MPKWKVHTECRVLYYNSKNSHRIFWGICHIVSSVDWWHRTLWADLSRMFVPYSSLRRPKWLCALPFYLTSFVPKFLDVRHSSVISYHLIDSVDWCVGDGSVDLALSRCILESLSGSSETFAQFAYSCTA